MGLKNYEENLNKELEKLYNVLYKKGFLEGYNHGYEHGFQDGQRRELESHNAAVSEGLRAGSSECGKQMRRRKNNIE